MKNVCGYCAHYGEAPLKGPICTKTGMEVSFLASKDCFEERDPTPALLKVCTSCHRELPLSEFNRNHTRKDGYQDQCRQCQSEAAADWYRRKKENPEAFIKKEPDPNATTKVCARCGRELPVERFGHTLKNRNGLKSYCKECENEVGRQSRARLKAERAANPKPKPETIPDAPLDLTRIIDDAIIAELRRRGWHGTITKNTITF